ncbi:MAG: DOMON-like domain-containing protein [Aquirhabdus sp.]
MQFKVDDPLHQISWQVQQQLEQLDYLWENTCFEAFISTPNQREYFELNLSPSLAWNLYRFTDYRTPNDMPPVRVLEPALSKFEIEDHLITVNIDLNALKLADQEIKLGLTAVIKTNDSTEYLTLHHPKSEADFHDSMGWTIRLLPEG